MKSLLVECFENSTAGCKAEPYIGWATFGKVCSAFIFDSVEEAANAMIRATFYAFRNGYGDKDEFVKLVYGGQFRIANKKVTLYFTNTPWEGGD